MPQPYGQAVLTDKGEELLAKSSAGQCLIEYVCMAVGDGKYSGEEKQNTELKKRIGLKGEKNRYAFSGAVLENNAVRLTALLTNQDPVTAEGLVTEGYYINEVGIYAKEKGADNSTAILYSMCLTASDTGLGDYMPAYAGHNRAEITQDYILHIGDNINISVNMIGAVALAEDLKECENEINRHILDHGNPHGTTKTHVGLGKADNTADIDKPVSTAQQEAIDAVYQQATGYTDRAFSDLKAVAFTGKYTDLTDRHSIPAASTTTPKINGTAAVGTETAFARGDHVHPLQTSVTGSSGSCTGNAATATRLATARTISFTGAITGSANFNGSANVSIDTTATAMKGATSTLSGSAGAVPAPAAGAQAKYLRGDGTWQTPPDTNTTYSNMTAATASAAGKAGLVPAPDAGAQEKFLRGDGAWVNPTGGINITHYTSVTTMTQLMTGITAPCMCITSTENVTDKPSGKYGTIIIFKYSDSRISALCICTDGTMYHNAWNASTSAITGWK